MIYFSLIAAVMFFSLPPAHADLFKYKDEEGNLHVVDSMDAVPEKYKKAVKSGGSGGRDSEERSPCKGKRLCGVIFLASHCPICKVQQPSHKALLEKGSSDKNFGLMAIVGFAQYKGQNEEFAKGLGEAGVILDNDESRAKKLGVTTYPKYLVLDSNKNIVFQDSEANDWIQKNFGAQADGKPGAGFMPPPGANASFISPPGGARPAEVSGAGSPPMESAVSPDSVKPLPSAKAP